MKAGDRIIWDSRWGYEIGYFVGNSNLYNDYTVDLITGKCQGKLSVNMSEVIPYSIDLIKEKEKRYGYLKDFLDTL